MYVTRHLSHYQKFPNELSEAPEGPNSGILVIQDEEAEISSCFGYCKGLNNLPFPQNKKLTVQYVQNLGTSVYVSRNDVFFIPVLNLPLSSNHYYAISPNGKHKGEAFTCSKEEDMRPCCFCSCVKDVKPRPLDTTNIYQQVEIANYKNLLCKGKGHFRGKSVAEDGFPPCFLRKKGWSLHTKTPKNYSLNEALGLNAALRARLPDFNFPLSYKISENIVVGKWYTPFMFIKDGEVVKDQMENSMFYKITLEQRWEQIYTCNNGKGNSVHVDANIDREIAHVYGNKASWEEKNSNDGMIYFKGYDGKVGEETIVGLRVEVFQRMKWEQERVGFSSGKERQERVTRVEQFGGDYGNWSLFGCYVLVESFVVRRMDESLVMSCEFRHTHQIRTKWE